MVRDQLDEDAELMLAVRDGDSSAFRRLFDKYSAKMVAYVDRFFRNGALSEEITQEVFIKVYKARERYEAQARFSTWLYTIASRTCLNELRRGLHKAVTTDLDEGRELPGAAPAGPQQILEAERLRRGLEDAIAKLPEKQRLALLLTRFGGHSYAEVAQLLDITPAAVKSAIFRAAEAMRRAVKELDGTGEGNAEVRS